MRVYLDKTVVEAARERLRYIYDEFDNVVVSVSGGKDSLVTLHLAREVAREMGDEHLPITTMWIDQECEYQATVDTIERWKNWDDVEMLWCQFEFEITNGAGHEQATLTTWNREKEDVWMREKHPDAITENTYGTRDLKELLHAVPHQEFDGETVTIGGVRTDESPMRYLGLTSSHVYNGMTYGSVGICGRCYTLYPIYDWTYSDVWAYINDQDLEYNEVYDFQYQNGMALQDMRVSHVHHQQAIGALFNLQEFEPETYNRLCDRLDGIHSTATLEQEGLLPSKLPFMFETWREFRNYLLEKLIDDPEDRHGLRKKFFQQDMLTEHRSDYWGICRAHVNAILKNDTKDYDVLDQTRSAVTTERGKEIRDEKLRWLRNEREDIWSGLRRDGIIGYETVTRLDDES